MKAITLWQPWATWIAWGWKTIETRRHNRLASLVGQRIAIHAGKRWHEEAFEIAQRWLSADREIDTRLIRRFSHGDNPGLAPANMTGIVCTGLVLAAGIVGAGDSEAAMCDCSGNDLFGLVLDEIRAFDTPIPATGHQGIWEWNPPGSVPAI